MPRTSVCRRGSPDDQSVKLNALAGAQASSSGQQVFLPPGTYVVSDIQLPAHVNLLGVPGKSRLLFGGNKSLLKRKRRQPGATLRYSRRRR